MKEKIKNLKTKLPRTREDWNFIFHLSGFVGNILFWGAVLLGTYNKGKTQHPSPAEKVHVIVIDSAYAKAHSPVIFNSSSK